MKEWRQFPEGIQPIIDRPLSNGHPNPVKQYPDGWYFYDESWSACYGPYPTEARCQESSDNYSYLLSLGDCRGMKISD